ncbi:MAG: ATP-binding cassette domain-containing protein [Methanoregula sp.]|jgi:ABC-2 type transport system ATP-binding protein|uniref:ATP-binding cassette domain-containing protein n=1 Tax=Methanoregula sp. TaxID=2052170 RepID=UPI003D0B9F4D
MHIIETKNLTKTYGNLTAVDHLDLKIGKGEVFGLLGPNGAGKSTTLMMLTTLIPPTSGTALVNGFDILRQPDQVRKSIGIVFQDPSSDETLTGYENLKLHGLLYDMDAGLREERIVEVLALVELTDRKDDMVKKYSGGMRRRLELARGLMHHPEILFLDEPTLGLDPQTREHIWEYIRRLATEKKITIIITTHYMDEADRLCDRLAIIDRGKIAVLGPPDQLKKELGGDIIRMRAGTFDMESLRELDYVTNVKTDDGGISVTVRDASQYLQDLLGRVGKVEGVEVRPLTLEDVFIHYTGRAIREGAPEGGWAEKVMRAGSRR